MTKLRHIANTLGWCVTDMFRDRDKDEKAADHAASIMDILNTLPDKKQEALVELLANTARLMQE